MPDTQPADTDTLPLIRLFEGDSLDVLRTIPDHTYTAVVTDPPYGLSAPPDPFDVLAQWLADGDFVRTGGRKKAPPPGLSEFAARFANTSGPGGMLGFKWDAFVPGPRLWREVFRVCKPGAIVLAFAGTRTQHWMALSLVLAGFEVIDCVGWITSQGMAKAGTVDKRIDQRMGVSHLRKIIGEHPAPSRCGKGNAAAVGPAATDGPLMVTAPATDLSGEWAGWSTQLGPALEPIIVARKPCEGTAVENILRYGCGAMNIDACRIASVCNDDYGRSAAGSDGMVHAGIWTHANRPKFEQHSHEAGRWPKNAIFSKESAAVLNAQVGERKSGSRRIGARKGMGYHGADGDGGPAIEGSSGDASRFFAVIPDDPPDDKDGRASRFFWVGPLATEDDVALPVRYVPKASRRERNAGLAPGAKGDHPTKKPRKLMEWLCRLVGHPKGRILDPFAGSGSTLAAARAMGLPCDGVERDEHYCRDLAAPTAGVDPADVVRVPPPSDVDRPLDAAPRVPYYETVRPPRPPVTFPIAYSAGVPVTAPSAPAPALSTVVAPRVTEDTPPPVPSLEVPAPAQADASYGLPPMFPRLPGAPEVP